MQNNNDLSSRSQELIGLTTKFALSSDLPMKSTMTDTLMDVYMDILKNQWKVFLVNNAPIFELYNELQLVDLRDAFNEIIGLGHRINWAEQTYLLNKENVYDNYKVSDDGLLQNQLNDAFEDFVNLQSKADGESIDGVANYVLETINQFASLMISDVLFNNKQLVDALKSGLKSQEFEKFVARTQQEFKLLMVYGYVLSRAQDSIVLKSS